MLIVLEGPNKAGKTSIIEKVVGVLDPDHVETLHFTKADEAEGWGYMPHFLKHLDTHKIQVWDRAWVGEYVYGKLFDQPRAFASDPFYCEWVYSRSMVGRGGKFIVLPRNPNELERRQKVKEDPKHLCHQEYGLFSRYALKHWYPVLINDYNEASLTRNYQTATLSALVKGHKIRSRDYVGAFKPAVTFVSDLPNTIPGLEDVPLPMFNEDVADLFRQFTPRQIQSWGYATSRSFYDNVGMFPELFRRVVYIGDNPIWRPNVVNFHFTGRSPNRTDAIELSVAIAEARSKEKVR